MSTTAQRNSGGGAMSKSSRATQAAPPATPSATQKRCTKEDCGGVLEPSIDRNRVPVMECKDCGTIYRALIGSSGTSMPAAGSDAPSLNGRDIATATAVSCRVKGCPGKLDRNGGCPNCAKRAKYLDTHIPPRLCEICDGHIEAKGARKFCDACKPVAAKVKVAQWKKSA